MMIHARDVIPALAGSPIAHVDAFGAVVATGTARRALSRTAKIHQPYAGSS